MIHRHRLVFLCFLVSVTMVAGGFFFRQVDAGQSHASDFFKNRDARSYYLLAKSKTTDRSIRRNSGRSSDVGKRYALVIGNSDYQKMPLKNPVNDADDIAKALKNLGFDVILKKNAGYRDMDMALRDFGRRLRNGGVGLFYFAGHGIQIDGHNFLIPVDAVIEGESDVRYGAIQAGRILGKMDDAGNSLNIVILDACRDNPFTRSFRSAVHGLAQMDAPKGTIIAYATSPGSVAADGDGRNGVYTASLLKYLNRGDLHIKEVFNQTGLAVMKETDEKQVPWLSSTPVKPFFLASSGMSIDKPVPPEQPLQKAFLSVSCNVPDAGVYLDGKKIGTGSISDHEVQPGSHIVLVEKEGYKSYQSRLSFENGRSRDLQVILDRLTPPKGRLYVECTPTDANIQLLSLSTSFYQGMELEPGDYQVKASANGYEERTLWVKLSPGRDKTLTIQLQKRQAALPETLRQKSPTMRQILDKGQIRVGFEAGYMPFEMTDKNGNFVGFDIDLARDLARELNVRFVPVNTAWDGIIPKLMTDKFDVLISGMTITESRAKHVDFTIPYFIMGQTIILHERHRGKVKSYNDLNDSRYIVTSKLGTTGEQAVQRKIPRCIYKSFETETDAFLEVKNGNADAFVYDLGYCAIAQAMHGTDNLVFLDKPFTYEPLGFAVRKNDPAFVEFLNAFIRQIKNDGRYDRYYHKWFNQGDWYQRIN